MKTEVPFGDLAFISHLPQDLASGGGLYLRAILDLLRSVWTPGSVQFVGPRTEVTPSRLVCVAWAQLSGQPSKAVFAARTGLSTSLKQTSIGQQTAICLNSPDALPLLERKLPDAKLVLVCHNIEAELFRQQVSRLPALTQPIFSKDVKRYAALEDRAFRKASLIIAISDSDIETIKQKHTEANILHIPPVFEHSGQPRSPQKLGANLRLGFVGRMNWWPNRDAVHWMQQNLTPLPDGQEIHLFGVGSDEMSDPQNALFGHGFVKDADAMWNEIDVALCPMKTGGGVNIKLVEALVRGVPVITTSFGARGLGIELSDRPGLRILDGDDAWRAFVASDRLKELAAETPDPSIANHFRAETHAPRLASALRDIGLLP